MHYDDRFFWNNSMLNKLLENKNVNNEWIIPIIQGHYDSFEINLNGNNIKYCLISRRSKYRSGARYYSRGINENGNCANFIET
jgi:phosphatidylinositol 4-phosphatase